MKIDKNVEPVVREAFAAAVAQEPDRFDADMLSIANRGEDFTQASVDLAIAVDVAALFALHEGIGPSDDAARELATEFVESEAWSEIPITVAEPFFVVLASGDPTGLRQLGLGDIAQASFVVAGWLLSAFLPEGKDWTDMLDELLAQLEATPPV